MKLRKPLHVQQATPIPHTTHVPEPKVEIKVEDLYKDLTFKHKSDSGYLNYVDYQSWGKVFDEDMRIKKEKMEKELAEQKAKYDAWFAKAVAKHGDYWIGPFGVYVPWSISRVPAVDGTNYCNYFANIDSDGDYQIGQSMVLGNTLPFTADEYRENFCDEKDTKWIYVGRKITTTDIYWE